jgi:hypothetical protein
VDVAGNCGQIRQARQHRALKGRSTTHALIDILHIWHQALDDRNSVRVLFIDYSKAFDQIDHATVLDKMASLGVPPAFHPEMDALLFA